MVATNFQVPSSFLSIPHHRITTMPMPLSFVLLVFAIPPSQAFDYFTNCTGSPNYTQNSLYKTNLHTLLATLPPQASITGFYNSSLGQNSDQVYALYTCRADVTSQRCSACVYLAQLSILQQCPSQLNAVIWFDQCMVRFSNKPVFHKMVDAPSNVAWNPVNIASNETRVFHQVLNKTINDLVDRTANNVVKFSTEEANVTESQKLYTAAQCTPDLTENDCLRCLKTAISKLPFMLGAKVLLPSCYLRFDISPFYGSKVNTSFFLPKDTNSTGTSIKEERKKTSSTVAVFVAVPLVLGVLILFVACYYFQKHKSHPSPELGEINTTESLQFDFRTIKAATDNFSIQNKLGEGGFGAVYRGKLSNGQEIAVKRLSTNSGQGIKEFKTEVLLVARLQHNNLVRLLGFCLRRNEKLLVYELLPKSSLDKVLLDPNKPSLLDWETRYKITAGIARGLLYLHEDSRLRIIHRDLKSSNILLDESMNPKISDFGLARLVGSDQIQADTNRIVGTYGYMAPEYAMTGRFSVKSDVYSFGVIVLEIVSGCKCNSTVSPHHEESLIQRAWRLWKADQALELVDLRLGSSFLSNEVARCIHISLLCIQEDVNKRPTMATVVAALNGHTVDLLAPEPPQVLTSHHSDGSGHPSSTFSGNRDITEVFPR